LFALAGYVEQRCWLIVAAQPHRDLPANLCRAKAQPVLPRLFSAFLLLSASIFQSVNRANAKCSEHALSL